MARRPLEESWALVDDGIDAEKEDPTFSALSMAEKGAALVESVLSTITWISDNNYSAVAVEKVIEGDLSSSGWEDEEEATAKLEAEMIQKERQIKRNIKSYVSDLTSAEDLKDVVEKLFQSIYGEAIVGASYVVSDNYATTPEQLVVFRNSTASDFFYGIVFFLSKEVRQQKFQLRRYGSIVGSPAQELRLLISFLSTILKLLMRAVTKDNIRYRVMLLRYLLEEFNNLISTQLPASPDGVVYRLIRFIGDYEDPKYICTGKLLGKGAFAEVFLAYNVKTGQPVAIKMIDTDTMLRKSPKLKAYLKSELKIMKSLDCTNIVKLCDVLPEGTLLHVVLEYCGGGTLQELIAEKKRLSEREALHWLRQLALAIKELRKKMIVHRDLKPANLLFNADRSCLKITDFGFARELEAGKVAESMVGTPLYLAPEILWASPEAKGYTEKADVWSVGVILFEMLTGRCPFMGNDLFDLSNKLKKYNISDHPMYKELSPTMQQFVSAMLTKDYNLRLSWPEFFQHLSVDQQFCAACVHANNSLEELRKALLKEQDALKVAKHNLEMIEKERSGLIARLAQQEEREKQWEEKEAQARAEIVKREAEWVKEKEDVLAILQQKDTKIEEVEKALAAEIERRGKQEQDTQEKERMEKLEKQAKEETEKREATEKEMQLLNEQLQRVKQELEKQIEENKEMAQARELLKSFREDKDKEEEEKKRKKEQKLKEQQQEKERKEKEEQEIRDRELKAEQERKAKEEEERKETERKQKEEQEKREKEQLEKNQKEKEENEKKEKEQQLEKNQKEEIEKAELEKKQREEQRERKRKELRERKRREKEERAKQISDLEMKRDIIAARLDRKLAKKYSKEADIKEVEALLRNDEQSDLDHLLALEFNRENFDLKGTTNEYNTKLGEVNKRREKADAELKVVVDKREACRKRMKKELKAVKREIRVLKKVEADEDKWLQDWEANEQRRELQEEADEALARQLDAEEKNKSKSRCKLPSFIRMGSGKLDTP